MALLYAKSHEWYEEASGKIGISEYAANALVDIVFVDLPEVGAKFAAGESFATLESVKAVSDIYMPIGGVITEINEALLDNTELINQNAENTWFVVIQAEGEVQDLMDKEAYLAFCDANPEA